MAYTDDTEIEEVGNTVVSAYYPPGYKPTSASVPPKEFHDCFCYPLHSKVSFFSPTGCKYKLLYLTADVDTGTKV